MNKPKEWARTVIRCRTGCYCASCADERCTGYECGGNGERVDTDPDLGRAAPRAATAAGSPDGTIHRRRGLTPPPRAFPHEFPCFLGRQRG